MQIFYIVSLVSFLSDRISKFLILKTIQEPVSVFPFFKIVKVWNPNLVFGLKISFLKSENLIIFLKGLLLCVIFILAIKSKDKFEKMALGMIFGGGLGNLTDRIFFGKVLDFLYFHYKNLYWPAFNVADIFITLGIVLYVWRVLRNPNKSKQSICL